MNVTDVCLKTTTKNFEKINLTGGLVSLIHFPLLKFTVA